MRPLFLLLGVSALSIAAAPDKATFESWEKQYRLFASEPRIEQVFQGQKTVFYGGRCYLKGRPELLPGALVGKTTDQDEKVLAVATALQADGKAYPSSFWDRTVLNTAGEFSGPFAFLRDLTPAVSKDKALGSDLEESNAGFRLRKWKESYLGAMVVLRDTERSKKDEIKMICLFQKANPTVEEPSHSEALLEPVERVSTPTPKTSRYSYTRAKAETRDDFFPRTLRRPYTPAEPGGRDDYFPRYDSEFPTTEGGRENFFRVPPNPF